MRGPRGRAAYVAGAGVLALLFVIPIAIVLVTRDPAPDVPEPTPTPTAPAPRQAEVEYERTNQLFPNPERGLYITRYSQTLSEGYEPLDVEGLQGTREYGHTLVKRYFMLSDYVDRDITGEFLQAMEHDFEAARDAGVKLVVRFAYSTEEDDPAADAPPDIIHRHIDQLAPLLHEHGDVIAVVQAGFIGVWGEWAYTDHFSDPYDEDYSDRQEVLEHLLHAVPDDRFVQIRTPRYKYRMDLDEDQAARVGFHNDCFLRGATDGGTYLDEDIEGDRAYLEAEAEDVPIGGETCTSPEDRFADTLDELALFRWSFLNGGFHPDHLIRWDSEGMLDEIERRLGYRFELVRGDYPNRVTPGEPFTIAFEIHNSGWAAPYNPRAAELILRHTATGEEHAFELEADPRAWEPGETYAIAERFTMREDLPAGEYELFLYLPDPSPDLYWRPGFAIRLANEQVWEPETGYNRLLHVISVG